MIVNDRRPIKKSKVEFLSYDGKYPNYCSGVLTLKIDGKEITFGTVYNRDDAMYPKFWHIGEGEWETDYDRIPDHLKEHIDEIDKALNEEVLCRHCGGCQ